MNLGGIPESPDTCKVYTPTWLAAAIVRVLGDSKSALWLEPSCGTGSFLAAMDELSVDKKRIVALDLSLETSDNDELAKTTRGVDFLTWAHRTNKRFTKIVGNPPYVSMHRLCETQRTSALGAKSPLGLITSKSSNLWLAFMHSLLELLEEGGDIAMILPAAWLYANYAQPTRKYVETNFSDIAVFRPRARIFTDAKDGSIVLIAKGYKQKRVRKRLFLDCDLDALESDYLTQQVVKPKNSKAKVISDRFKTAKLKELATISIGGVTGQADYFILSDDERKLLGLPVTACRPILSKTAHLMDPITDKETWLTLRFAGERVWLFYPTPSQLSHSAVQEYLLRKVENGGCDKMRLKIASRTPWYLTKLPPTVDAFVSGMASLGPSLFLNRFPRLTYSNTLYGLRFRSKLSLEAKSTFGLAFLTPFVREQLASNSRVYPEGLRKHEPGDISDICVPIYEPRKHHVALFRKASLMFMAGETEALQHLLKEKLR